MSSMIMRKDLTAVVDKTISVNIVDIAVVVVIHSVAGNLIIVNPHIVFEIRMVCLYSSISYRDDNVGTSRFNLPGVEQLDISAGTASALTCVMVMPLSFEKRIIGSIG